jgi:hypothetical protein
MNVTMSALVWLALAGTLLAEDARSASVEIAPGSMVRFADAEEGQAILAADDAFTKGLSRFDLQSRLKTGEEITLDDWKRSVAAEVRGWTTDQKKPVVESLERLSKRLAGYELPLPKEIPLVHTTGQEEGNAAYTRGAAIILPDKVLKYAPVQLDKLLAHELFHVISRHDGALRQRLYRNIGFEVCEPIELPPSLAPRKITNPDAPLIDCTIELKSADGKVFTGAPVLYANAKQYDATKGGSFFQYLTFRLIVVERKDRNWQPLLLESGEPVVIDAKKEDAFYEKIGKNTNYVIHPDEILADNFVHLVMENRDLMTPRIVEEMKLALTK